MDISLLHEANSLIWGQHLRLGRFWRNWSIWKAKLELGVRSFHGTRNSVEHLAYLRSSRGKIQGLFRARKIGHVTSVAHTKEYYDWGSNSQIILDKQNLFFIELKILQSIPNMDCGGLHPIKTDFLRVHVGLINFILPVDIKSGVFNDLRRIFQCQGRKWSPVFISIDSLSFEVWVNSIKFYCDLSDFSKLWESLYTADAAYYDTLSRKSMSVLCSCSY